MGRASDRDYDGVAYEDLNIEHVTWSVGAAEHMATRSERYMRPQFDVADCAWATQAACDPNRLTGDGRSRDRDTIRVIGWSPSAPASSGEGSGRLLKVWLEADGPAIGGRWIGRTACEANDTEKKAYRIARQEEEW